MAWLSIFYFSKPLFAQSVHLIKVQRVLHQSLNLTDSLESTVSIQKLNLSPEQAQQISNHETDKKPPVSKNTSAHWLVFEMDNTSGKSQPLYLQTCSAAKATFLYVFHGNRLVTAPSISGNEVLENRMVPAHASYLPLNLPLRQRVRVVVCSYFDDAVESSHYHEISLFSQQVVNQAIGKKISFQYFYAGVMLLIVFLSIVFSFVLKTRSIFYYAMIVFLFVFYFMQSSGTDFITVRFLGAFKSYQLINICLILMQGFSFLFVRDYLQLKTLLPKYNRVLSLATVLAILCTPLVLLSNKFYLVSNLAIVIWLILLIAPCAYLAIKNHRSAKILFASFASLIAGAILYSLHLALLIDLGKAAFYSFQLSTLLFTFILLYAIVDKITSINRERIRMEEMDSLKTKFFQDISHELRTPLTLISDPIKQVVKELPEGSSKQKLITANNASKKLQALVNDILELSNLENNHNDLPLQVGNVTPCLQATFGSFETIARDKGIDMRFSAPKSEVWMTFNEDKMQKLFGNLVANALKFNSQEGVISVEVKPKVSFVEIKVSDTGEGISEKHLDYIFNRYYQAPQKKEIAEIGSGIGLALVKEWVTQQHGSIVVTSQLGKGTSFTLKFPLTTVTHKDSEAKEELKLTSTQTSQKERSIHFPVTENLQVIAQKPSVLVIEDHPELRAYLKELLSNEYDVWEAENGEMGIDMAFTKIPDLIVCDLMMPKKDGFEVTHSLKSDPRSSHIPVIILTARAAQEDKNKGLEFGADDYLLKPFDREELLLRIKNLLTQRLKLQKQLRENVSFESVKPTLHSIDQRFIEAIRTKIETDYANATLGLQELADTVSMSKAHMNRKLNSLTGTSAGKLIQAYRLKQAKLLVESREGTVAEIAHNCGFNSTAYFIKCYREKYGITPGKTL